VLCCLAHLKILCHAPIIPFDFSACSGNSGLSPSSSGCVLNQAPFSAMSFTVASSIK
jgi:hypothetical protein